MEIKTLSHYWLIHDSGHSLSIYNIIIQKNKKYGGNSIWRKFFLFSLFQKRIFPCLPHRTPYWQVPYKSIFLMKILITTTKYVFSFHNFFMHIIYWFHDFLKINKQIENEKDPYSPSHPRRSKRRNISRNNSKYNDEEPLQPISRMRRRNMADQQVRILISRIFLEFFFFQILISRIFFIYMNSQCPLHI